MGLGDKVAIVTGGAHGLGRVFSLALAREGVAVVVADIDFEAAVRVAKEIESRGGHVLAVKVDISDEEDTKHMVEECVAKFGGINILVNNAAIALRYRERARVPFDELTVEEWDRVMAVNARGMWLCCKAVSPYMKKQRKGKIINMSSGTFFIGAAQWVHYGASKGAVVGLTRALARELGDYDINVNVLLPSLTVTELGLKVYGDKLFDEFASARCIKRREYPEDLVGALLFLASDASDFITGQIINVDGGHVFH